MEEANRIGDDSGDADFWLGDRNSAVTDFDGRPRACRILNPLHVLEGRGSPYDDRYLWITVDPPLPMPDGSKASEVAILERAGRTDVSALSNLRTAEITWWDVFVSGVRTGSEPRRGTVRFSDLMPVYTGEIACGVDLLPHSQEQQFEMGYKLLKKFIDREGHSRIPRGASGPEIGLWTWASNMRFMHAGDALPRDWEKKLNALPGWSWDAPTPSDET